jgi:hypothetical protein
MLRYIGVLLSLLILTGCASGNKASTSVSGSYTTSDGSVVEFVKTATVESKKHTVNPPQVELDPVTFTPTQIGENKSILPDGTESSSPSVGVLLNTGTTVAIGSFLSNLEAKLPLLAPAMWLGGLLIAGGIAITFIFWNNPLRILRKLGIGLAIGGCGLMAFAWFLADIPVWVPLALFGVLILCATAFVLLYLNRSGKALKENIQTTEFLKNNVLTAEQREVYFKNPGAPVPLIQSPSTRNLIRNIRSDEGFTRG